MQIFCLTLSAILVAMPGLYAQEMNHPRITSYASATLRVPGTTSRVDDSNYLKPEFVNNITVSAVRDFIKRFSEQPNARWYKMRDASLMVKFEAPDISYRVAYTSGGNWIYTIQTYFEKKLPRDIRGIVKSTYYDYAITQVEEVNHVDADGTVYIVHLKDDVSWKTVRLSNGQMDELETLYKK